MEGSGYVDIFATKGIEYLMVIGFLMMLVVFWRALSRSPRIAVAQVQGARPAGHLVTKFDEYPGIEHFAVTVDHYAVVDGRYFYFDLPFKASLFPAGSDTRTLPLFISEDSRNQVRAEINLPSEFSRVIIRPDDKKLRAAGAGTAKVVAREADGKFHLTEDLAITPAIISPEEYPELQKLESNLREKSGQVLLLEKN